LASPRRSRLGRVLSVSLDITIGAGSAVFELAIGDRRVVSVASHFSDAIDELLRATLSAVVYGSRQIFVLDDEPGHAIWELQPQGDRLAISVSWSPRRRAREDDPDRRTLFDGECRLRGFAGAVVSALQALAAAHGPDGYLEAWHHAFPTSRVAELRNALGESPHRSHNPDSSVGAPARRPSSSE